MLSTYKKPILVLSSVLTFLTACAPTPEAVTDIREPELRESRFIARDGAELPLRIWNSKTVEATAVVVALHGFNDYSKAFDEVAGYWADNHQIYTYAYDQRGFGDTPKPGTWAGTDAYVQDLRDFCDVMRERFPATPLYVLGESMGGAIAMVAFSSDTPPDADGVILSAPAVWARKTMPWYQRLALFIGSYVMPGASFSGKGLGVTASDNREMLIAQGRDPKVIKQTKVAALEGLSDLMDAALQSADSFSAQSLILIGELDEVVPNHASATMLQRLQVDESAKQRAVVYEEGYHMLLRDLQRERVWNDVAAWIGSPGGSLPSGADANSLPKWIESHL